jgi:hypothetical protein
MSAGYKLTLVNFGVNGYDRLSCGCLVNDKVYEYLKKLAKQDLSQQHCARGVGGCFRKLKRGECKDPFVIENIGKVFFPDKYGKQR